VQGQISPSGRWLAYTSNRSSRYEVWIEALRGDRGPWQLSFDGGSDPKWRADENELFFVGSDGQMMSVDVAGGPPFDRVPRPLFQFRAIAVMSPFLSAYDVDRAGQRFLMRTSKLTLETQPLNVIVHWSVPGSAVK
jgi:hypothetical protein